jgi:hypothetical protein
MRRLTFSVAFLVWAAGCEGPVVPVDPTWVRDVRPILQGQCFHCHGASDHPTGAWRWDVYNADGQIFRQIGMDDLSKVKGTDVFIPHNATTAPRLIDFIRGATAPNIVRMPPPPATPLSEWEMEVLTRWVKNGAPERQDPPPPNAKPTADWLVTGQSFWVADADGEQVLGRVVCAGNKEKPVTRTGAHNVPGPPPCTVTLSDGFERSEIPLP